MRNSLPRYLIKSWGPPPPASPDRIDAGYSSIAGLSTIFLAASPRAAVLHDYRTDYCSLPPQLADSKPTTWSPIKTRPSHPVKGHITRHRLNPATTDSYDRAWYGTQSPFAILSSSFFETLARISPAGGLKVGQCDRSGRSQKVRGHKLDLTRYRVEQNKLLSAVGHSPLGISPSDPAFCPRSGSRKQDMSACDQLRQWWNWKTPPTGRLVPSPDRSQIAPAQQIVGLDVPLAALDSVTCKAPPRSRTPGPARSKFIMRPHPSSHAKGTTVSA